MKEAQRRESKSHALIEKPPLSVMLRGDGHMASDAASADRSREARIRESAYARFESRGRQHGHDLDDWLVAEAELKD